MKISILSLALALITLSSCNTHKASLDEQSRISWEAFCNSRGHDVHDYSGETMNEFFDAWCGTIEEEAAFKAAGINN